ncbi:MAG: sialidase family protein, partial [Vicinamibacteria bacterium]
LGRDPATRKRVLYVIFRTGSDDGAMAMHVVKADIDGVSGTAALEARLRDPLAWTFLPSRLSGLTSYAANGYDGTFRFSSYFVPALDPSTGWLFAALHALDPASRRSRALISRSQDGGATWTTPVPIDDPGRGNQLMPAVTARDGRVFAVWYDSRNDLEFAPLSMIRAVDVYAASLDDGLRVQRVSRLTPEAQRADRPVFTRPRPAGVSAHSKGIERPHDFDPLTARPSPDVKATATTIKTDCVSDRYGFIGDYIGIAANANEAWAAWTDLRDVTAATPSEICAIGHSCAGNRNQTVRAARIPR